MKLTIRDIVELASATNMTMPKLFEHKSAEWVIKANENNSSKVIALWQENRESFDEVLSETIESAYFNYLLAVVDADAATLFKYTYLKVFRNLLREFEIIKESINNK